MSSCSSGLGWAHYCARCSRGRRNGHEAGVGNTGCAIGYGHIRNRCQVRGVGDGDPVCTGKSSPVVEVDDEATVAHEGRIIQVEGDIVVNIPVEYCQSCFPAEVE